MSLISGNALFVGAVNCTQNVNQILGCAIFCSGAVNSGVTDNAIFCNSVNKGTGIGSNLIFNNSINSGKISGCACFGFVSKNFGQIEGTGDFNESSVNAGNVCNLILCDQSFNSGNYNSLVFLVDYNVPTNRYNNSGKYFTYVSGSGNSANGPYSNHYYSSGDLSYCTTIPNDEFAIDNGQLYLYQSGIPLSSTGQEVKQQIAIFGNFVSGATGSGNFTYGTGRYYTVNGSGFLSNRYSTGVCLVKLSDIVSYEINEVYDWVPNGCCVDLYYCGNCTGYYECCDFQLVCSTTGCGAVFGEYNLVVNSISGNTPIFIASGFVCPTGTVFSASPITAWLPATGGCQVVGCVIGSCQVILTGFSALNPSYPLNDRAYCGSRSVYCASGTVLKTGYLLYPLTNIGGLSIGHFSFASDGNGSYYKINNALASGTSITSSNVTNSGLVVGTSGWRSNGIDDVFNQTNYCSSGTVLQTGNIIKNTFKIGTCTYQSNGLGGLVLLNNYSGSGTQFSISAINRSAFEQTFKVACQCCVADGIGGLFKDYSFLYASGDLIASCNIPTRFLSVDLSAMSPSLLNCLGINGLGINSFCGLLNTHPEVLQDCSSSIGTFDVMSEGGSGISVGCSYCSSGTPIVKITPFERFTSICDSENIINYTTSTGSVYSDGLGGSYVEKNYGPSENFGEIDLCEVIFSGICFPICCCVAYDFGVRVEYCHFTGDPQPFILKDKTRRVNLCYDGSGSVKTGTLVCTLYTGNTLLFSNIDTGLCVVWSECVVPEYSAYCTIRSTYIFTDSQAASNLQDQYVFTKVNGEVYVTGTPNPSNGLNYTGTINEGYLVTCCICSIHQNGEPQVSSYSTTGVSPAFFYFEMNGETFVSVDCSFSTGENVSDLLVVCNHSVYDIASSCWLENGDMSEYSYIQYEQNGDTYNVVCKNASGYNVISGQKYRTQFCCDLTFTAAVFTGEFNNCKYNAQVCYYSYINWIANACNAIYYSNQELTSPANYTICCYLNLSCSWVVDGVNCIFPL